MPKVKKQAASTLAPVDALVPAVVAGSQQVPSLSPSLPSLVPCPLHGSVGQEDKAESSGLHIIARCRERAPEQVLDWKALGLDRPLQVLAHDSHLYVGAHLHD